jgi:hypothetical protein
MTTSQAPINEPFKSGRKSCDNTSGSCAKQNHTVLPLTSKNVRIGSQYVHLQVGIENDAIIRAAL